MRRFSILMFAVLMAACAADGKEKTNAALKNDAIDDFVKVSELEPQKTIRISGTMRHEAITEDYVIVTDRRNTWLISFQRRCYELDSPFVTPDLRREGQILRANVDTIRGCRISDIYPLTDGMREELSVLTRPYE